MTIGPIFCEGEWVSRLVGRVHQSFRGRGRTQKILQLFWRPRSWRYAHCKTTEVSLCRRCRSRWS